MKFMENLSIPEQYREVKTAFISNHQELESSVNPNNFYSAMLAQAGVYSDMAIIFTLEYLKNQKNKELAVDSVQEEEK